MGTGTRPPYPPYRTHRTVPPNFVAIAGNISLLYPSAPKYCVTECLGARPSLQQLWAQTLPGEKLKFNALIGTPINPYKTRIDPQPIHKNHDWAPNQSIIDSSNGSTSRDIPICSYNLTKHPNWDLFCFDSIACAESQTAASKWSRFFWAQSLGERR